MWASLLIADWQVRLAPAQQRGRAAFPKKIERVLSASVNTPS